MQFDDDEPIFKRGTWSRRYYYNPRNPVGLALIIFALVFGAVVLILMQTHTGPFAIPPDRPWTPLPTGDWSSFVTTSVPTPYP